MTVASNANWMECNLNHMWTLEEGATCPVCGGQGWLVTQRIDLTGHHTRESVLITVSELEAQIRHLRQVVAEQAEHHKTAHPNCPGDQ